MGDQFLTIITPTYNRAHLLHNLHHSLTKQSMTGFKWLIVDDGSTDDTRSVISKYQDNTKFSIDYIYKENGGKHTALNLGIQQVDTELTMIVDSDDTLLPYAIEKVRKYYLEYKEDYSIASWSFLRCFPNGKPIVELDRGFFVDNYIKYRINRNIRGDMAEVFRSEVLKEYPFPEFSGEKFLSEDIVWIEIGKKYNTVYINIPIYQCEYLEGGLTINDKPMKFSSPRGSMLRGRQLMSRECGIKANIRGAIIYDCYHKECKEGINSGVLTIREKVLTTACYPLGIFFNIRWKGK